MTSLSALQDVQTQLIRKALNAAVLVAEWTDSNTVDETALFDNSTGDIKSTVLGPLGYKDIGSTTTDGAQFARSISTSSVPILQSLSAGRIDISGDDTTIQVVCDETKLITLGLQTGAALSAIAPAANGVVRVDQPKTPPKRDWRVLSVAEDVYQGDSIFICRFLPRALITSYGTQTHGRGDNPIQTDVTFSGQYDDAVGTDHSWIYGGIGWKALLADMALDDESSSSS